MKEVFEELTKDQYMEASLLRNLGETVDLVWIKRNWGRNSKGTGNEMKCNVEKSSI